MCTRGLGGVVVGGSEFGYLVVVVVRGVILSLGRLLLGGRGFFFGLLGEDFFLLGE